MRMFGKYVPKRDEQRSDQRTENKAVDAESDNTAECGNQHHIIRHSRVPANENRAHEIINEADDDCSVRRKSSGQISLCLSD